jgi:hypothetical protein
MLPQCVSLIIWRWVDSGNQPHDTEVLLAKRSAFQFDDPSHIQPQDFFGGWQIFPSGKLGGDEEPLTAAWSKLRDYGGVRAMIGLKALVGRNPARLRRVGQNCFAVEIKESDKFDGDSDFLNLVDFSPNYMAIDWKPLAEILHFSDLVPYRHGVPKGVEAIFKDQLDLIKKLADQVRRIQWIS